MQNDPLDQGNARAYAKAAFAIAREEDRVREWGETLKTFAEGIQPVQHLLSAPVVSREQWAAIAEELADKAKLPTKEKGLMTDLAQRRNLHLLPKILSFSQAFDKQARGVENILITSAFEMNPSRWTRSQPD